MRFTRSLEVRNDATCSKRSSEILEKMSRAASAHSRSIMELTFTSSWFDVISVEKPNAPHVGLNLEIKKQLVGTVV